MDEIEELELLLEEMMQYANNIDDTLKQESADTNVDYTLLSRLLKKQIQEIKDSLYSE